MSIVNDRVTAGIAISNINFKYYSKYNNKLKM